MNRCCRPCWWPSPSTSPLCPYRVPFGSCGRLLSEATCSRGGWLILAPEGIDWDAWSEGVRATWAPSRVGAWVCKMSRNGGRTCTVTVLLQGEQDTGSSCGRVSTAPLAVTNLHPWAGDTGGRWGRQGSSRGFREKFLCPRRVHRGEAMSSSLGTFGAEYDTKNHAGIL